MANEHFDKKTCPVLKKCRHEAFFSKTSITGTVIILVLIAVCLIAAVIIAIMTEDVAYLIAAVIGILVLLGMLLKINFGKLRGLSETAKYLGSLSYEDYSSLVSQVENIESVDTFCLLDGWFFAPSAPILTAYKDLTRVELQTMYYHGRTMGYTLKLRFRKKKREFSPAPFDTGAFRKELDQKMQEASAKYEFVYSEKKM